jgi:hypothetical protein
LKRGTIHPAWFFRQNNRGIWKLRYESMR